MGYKFLGIEYTFERLTRSGRRHPKVRIRTAVCHLSSPGVVNQYNLTPSKLISVLRTVLQLRVEKAYSYNIRNARLFIVWLR